MNVVINYWAVLVAAIASMVIGSVWYGPLFGKKFMHEKGMDSMSEDQKAQMKKGMTMKYVWQFVASLVMFAVLDCFIVQLNKTGISGGLSTAFWAWLGFVVPLSLGEALWGGKMSLFWLAIGHTLVTLLAAGAIIGAW